MEVQFPIAKEKHFMISDAFRAYANNKNVAAGGRQNAQLHVIYLDMGAGPKRWEWMGTEEYLGHGDHTERRLINRFWTDFNQVHRYGAHYRLCRVEVFTRFNTCVHCTGDLIRFKHQLRQVMERVEEAKFDVADRGNVYLPVEGNAQITIPEGLFRKEAASSDLRLDGWVVETRIRTGTHVADLSTLGTAADPIVIN